MTDQNEVEVGYPPEVQDASERVKQAKKVAHSLSMMNIIGLDPVQYELRAAPFREAYYELAMAEYELQEAMRKHGML